MSPMSLLRLSRVEPSRTVLGRPVGWTVTQRTPDHPAGKRRSRHLTHKAAVRQARRWDAEWSANQLVVR